MDEATMFGAIATAAGGVAAAAYGLVAFIKKKSSDEGPPPAPVAQPEVSPAMKSPRIESIVDRLEVAVNSMSKYATHEDLQPIHRRLSSIEKKLDLALETQVEHDRLLDLHNKINDRHEKTLEEHERRLPILTDKH